MLNLCRILPFRIQTPLEHVQWSATLPLAQITLKILQSHLRVFRNYIYIAYSIPLCPGAEADLDAFITSWISDKLCCLVSNPEVGSSGITTDVSYLMFNLSLQIITVSLRKELSAIHVNWLLCLSPSIFIKTRGLKINAAYFLALSSNTILPYRWISTYASKYLKVPLVVVCFNY